jgi:hypothetical protein
MWIRRIMIIADADFWKNFWPNWWANFAANLIVGILLTALIGWIIRKREKLNVAMQTTLRVMEDGGARAYFGIVNLGNVVMRKDDVHFHVFVREARIPEKILKRMPSERRVQIAGNLYLELKGTLDRTIFPDRETLATEIEVISTDFDIHDFLYYLSTANGIFPKSCKIDRARRRISGFGCMIWFHVFPNRGDAKVITPQQKIAEMIAEGKAKPPEAVSEST